MITKDTIDKVFETSRVEEVIGDFVNLKKAGANFKGLSPFVDERTPSFMVSPVKQIWKDFSTGKGGNAITFLMEHEHYTYPEAIRYLARKYNIEIEETIQSDEQKKHADERESMYLVSEFAKKYFHENLFNSEKGKAIGYTYFKERGFTDQTIKKFELGYALDEWTAFTDAAVEKKYDLEFLEKTGLAIIKEANQLGEQSRKFDRFKGRVIFPIQSMSGRVLGFGGRTLLTDKKVAKYLNSPESIIYHKSKILYGIYQAKQSIAKEDNCYLVEGYTDVISMFQTGIENVVASSGTALTADQIRLVNRLTPNITVLFDGDAAGIRASIRGIDLILEQGMNVKVVTFPDGEDPDSFARNKTTEELKKYLEEQAQDFIQFKTSLLLDAAKNDPIKKAALIRDIVASISKIPNNIQKEIYVQECAQIMGVSEKVLFDELSQNLKKEQREASKKQSPSRTSFTGVVKETKQVENVDQINGVEKELIKNLFLNGTIEINFIDFVKKTDEDGKENIIKKNYKNTVAEEIYLNLQDDEIEFSNNLFRLIYDEVINQINQSETIKLEEFINHENSEVRDVITDILMEEEKHNLHRWHTQGIFPKAKDSENEIRHSVTNNILKLRAILIIKLINELNFELKEISYENNKIKYIEKHQLIIDYRKLSSVITEKSGRVPTGYYLS